MPRPLQNNTSTSVEDLIDGQQPQTEVQHPESDGDAQPETDDRVDSDPGSASEAEELDDSQQDTVPVVDEDEMSAAVMPADVAPVVAQRPPIQPRRSTRVRTEPKWLTSGEYVTKSAVEPAQWKQKANCISSFLDRGLFTGIETEAGRTLLSIMKETNKLY